MNKKILTTIVMLMGVDFDVDVDQEDEDARHHNRVVATRSAAPLRAVEDVPAAQRVTALSLQFEPNQDQTNNQAEFLAREQGYSLNLTQTEGGLALRNSYQPIPTVVRMRLTSTDPPIAGIETKELDGKVNCFLGDDPNCWRRDIPTFATFVYTRGDRASYGNQRQLAAIQIAFAGTPAPKLIPPATTSLNLSLPSSPAVLSAFCAPTYED